MNSSRWRNRWACRWSKHIQPACQRTPRWDHELPSQPRRQGLMELQDQLVDETKKRCKEEGYPKFTDEQVKTYTEMGGTPFLDNQYTVFGEVEEGLDVVENPELRDAQR